MSSQGDLIKLKTILLKELNEPFKSNTEEIRCVISVLLEIQSLRDEVELLKEANRTTTVDEELALCKQDLDLAEEANERLRRKVRFLEESLDAARRRCDALEGDTK